MLAGTVVRATLTMSCRRVLRAELSWFRCARRPAPHGASVRCARSTSRDAQTATKSAALGTAMMMLAGCVNSDANGGTPHGADPRALWTVARTWPIFYPVWAKVSAGPRLPLTGGPLG